MSEYPDFVIVCDHGIAGDPAPDLVWRYRWDDTQGVWTPEGEGLSPPGIHKVIYGAGAVTVTFMTGRREGFHIDKVDDERMREHHEIKCLCLKPRCGRRVRIPDEHLQQAVFAVISARSPSRPELIPVPLAAIQRIRDEVDALGALPPDD